jgi:hypothetical protein
MATLDEFIDAARDLTYPKRWNSNAWVSQRKFEGLYVRYSDRYVCLDQESRPPKYIGVLDIANVTVYEEYRGQGVFTNLVTRLRKKYPDLHLFVENAIEDRFQKHLLKIGFLEVPGTINFFLEAQRISP